MSGDDRTVNDKGKVIAIEVKKSKLLAVTLLDCLVLLKDVRDTTDYQRHKDLRDGLWG